MRKTGQNLANLSLSTATTTQTAFIEAVTLANMQVSAGAMPYARAIREAIQSAAADGARVLYPSGRTDHLDVAVRRATLTGVNQTAAELQMMRAEEMGLDLVEVTAHHGARTGIGWGDHVSWQGRVYRRKRF